VLSFFRFSGVVFLCIVSFPGFLRAFEALPRRRPEKLAIDPIKLEEAIEDLGEINGMWSVVVIRKGNVVAEDYFTGPPEELHPVWSVTKSITSTLTGMAMDRELISSLDQSMTTYLPSGLEPADPRAEEISIRNLLMMTSGLRWSEDSDWLPWIYSSDPARFILDRRVVTIPGNVFNYSSASSHIPSVILTEVLREDPAVFAGRELFEPLGISDWRWQRDPQGYPFGGHGVELRTEDLGKFGVLFLKGGLWGSRRIVSRSWVNEAVQPRFFWEIDYGPLENVDYGYLWWTAEAAGYPVFIAWGWGGQFSFCVPDLELVVATAADGMVEADQAEEQEIAILDVIVGEILPAVKPIRRLLNPVTTPVAFR